MDTHRNGSSVPDPEMRGKITQQMFGPNQVPPKPVRFPLPACCEAAHSYYVFASALTGSLFFFEANPLGLILVLG